MALNHILTEVFRRYSEPHRKYHTLEHIMKMFALACNRGIELTDEQVLAVWLHDIVYWVPADPKESNEVASARFAFDLLREGDQAKKVSDIIRDTEQELPTVEGSAVVIDLDLAGLARAYWPNRRRVREEYACYSDEEFRVGRRKWVMGMLKRKSIYVSGKFDDLEADARKELKKDLLLCYRDEPKRKTS